MERNRGDDVQTLWAELNHLSKLVPWRDVKPTVPCAQQLNQTWRHLDFVHLQLGLKYRWSFNAFWKSIYLVQVKQNLPDIYLGIFIEIKSREKKRRETENNNKNRRSWGEHKISSFAVSSTIYNIWLKSLSRCPQGLGGMKRQGKMKSFF